ncbi:hypothetical protein [Rubellimicrobium aerolatum]|uniref:Nuclear transport factor 2 family protein n=1 Tax=Rubellimicrobium aerolatum TaxID=490979 RepID=A0ABW0SAY2_9RHOB|nr:hypothetical protein [Rubellimicrobium aerolatum]MBP1805379.1 hypothetical protein [Rubellimicrobium aerolatum]
MVPGDRTSLPVSALFARLGELFSQGDVAGMAALWTLPCPVEVEGGLVILRSRAMLEAVLSIRCAQARVAGLRRATPRIAAIEMPRRGRFRVWLRWEYEFPGGPLVADRFGSVYYLARTSQGGLTIEMMDVVHAPAPPAL